MKLFTKVMAAALLSTAISGAVMAADINLDTAGAKKVLKAANMKQMSAALGIEKNVSGTAVTITIDPATFKTLMTVDADATFTEAEPIAALKAFKNTFKPVVDAADSTGDQLDNAIAALAGFTGLKSEEFAFKKADPSLGIPADYVASLVAQVSPNPFATIEADGTYKALHALKAAGAASEAGAASTATHTSLKALIDALDAADAKKPGKKGADAAAVSAEIQAILDDAAKFKGGAAGKTVAELAALYAGTVPYTAYAKKKADLRAEKEIAVKAVKPSGLAARGESLLQRLVKANGDDDLGTFFSAPAIKALGDFTQVSLEAKSEKDVSDAFFTALNELNDLMVDLNAKLNDANKRLLAAGKAPVSAGSTRSLTPPKHRSGSPLPGGKVSYPAEPTTADGYSIDMVKRGMYTYDPATGQVKDGGRIVHQENPL